MDLRFLTVWFGQVVSQFGTSLSGFGAAVWVFVETESFAWLAALIVATMIPPLVTAPILGLIDRFDRRMVMLSADAGAAAATATVVLIWTFSDLRSWHLLGAAFLGGLFASLQRPAYAAAIPALIDRDRLERANGLVQMGPSLAVVAAPGVAGLLIAGPGVGSVFVVDLATFAVALVSVLVVRFRAKAEIAPDDDLRLLVAAR